MSRRRKRNNVSDDVNLTPMIDVVFQMIISFVCTVELEKLSLNESIRLALSPHGPAVEKKDPRTVTVDVDQNGKIYFGSTRLSPELFLQIMRKTVSDYGQDVPVVIRGDGKTKHDDIRKVMDACKGAGLWRVKFAAIKDKV
ncbi:MAG: hypothetical protein GKR87_10115 [Kiritimatiellae bacterium]|nr:hypothetical protein [Kiritimatiellia bacterium]